MGIVPFVPISPHLFKCGVLHRLFLSRSATTFSMINENSTPHFPFLTQYRIRPLQESCNGNTGTMKRFLFLSFAVVLLFGCGGDYDDSALLDRMNGLEERVAKLEELCKQLNADVAALQNLLEAVQASDFVTGITPVEQNGEIVGYVISFAKHDAVTIYHGRKGDSGTVPAIGVIEIEGVHYWTLDGTLLTDVAGNLVPTSGLTPQFKIEDGYWYLSYDGTEWQRLGQATGDKGEVGAPGGDSIFSKVQDTATAVIFTLADGKTTITIPRQQALKIVFDVDDELFFDIDQTRIVNYTIQGGTDKNVVKAEMQNLDGGYTLRTASSSATRGKITIMAGVPTVNKVIVSVSDGTQTIMTAISVSIKPGFDGSTVTVATPGTLNKLLADYDKTTIIELTVAGNLNSSDISTLKALPNLAVLDMERTNWEELPNDAFNGKKTLTSVRLPRGLKNTGERVFAWCTSLTSVVFPVGLMTISRGAFSNSDLTNVDFPESLTTIGESAFSYCNGLTNMVLPASLTAIGRLAFLGCSSLTDVYCKATIPPETGEKIVGTNNSVILHVPIGCADAYKEASGWGDFKNIVETDF